MSAGDFYLYTPSSHYNQLARKSDNITADSCKHSTRASKIKWKELFSEKESHKFLNFTVPFSSPLSENH